jgi:chemotaxis protein CheX
MSENVTTASSPPTEEFASCENLHRFDAAVKEIFDMMFGLGVAANPHCSYPRQPDESGERTAIVGFSGSMRGSCQIRIGRAAAESIASAMLGGAPLDGNDDSINDALGELCNMLAGGWKNGIPDLSSDCSLSPPTIIAGLDYKIQMSKASSKLCRTYKFGDHTMDLTLYREEANPT